MRRALYSFLLVVFLIAITFATLSVLFPLPPVHPYSLIIMDRKGEFLHAFLASDGIWRFKTSPSEIPPRLKEILLHKEDRFFYYHPGINPISVLRAVFQNIHTGKRVSGASTITMQVARMLEPKERTYFHKFVEIFRALQLEARYSKDEILEIYLSIIPLGGNIEGLQSAAYLYYRTPLERLNIAQLIDLILLPKDPNRFRPDKNPDNLYRERTKNALQWLSEGLLSKEDSVILWQTPANVIRSQMPSYAHHFALRIKELHGNENSVVSSLDKKMQLAVEKVLQRHVQVWRRHDVHNGAALVIDNATHEIAAYVGSGNFDDSTHSGQVDAVQALRSPGSTLKPFLYAFHIDKGTLTSKTRMLDVPYDAEGYVAENYDATYAGWVFADDALRHSLNVPMVRLLYEVGARKFIDYLGAAGLRSLIEQKEKLGLSMILGGCGVTLEELTGAYAALPHKGIFTQPLYTRYDSSSVVSSQICSDAAAYIVTDILSNRDQSEPESVAPYPSLPKIAYKTGTSYGRRDAWCIGYSKDYTVGVWLGNADNKGAPDLVSSKATLPLLFDIFQKISTRNTAEILPMPGDVGERSVCEHSGKVPTALCVSVTRDLYSRSRTLQRFCDVDKEYFTSLDGRMHYCMSCLGNNAYKTKVFQEYPPEYTAFLKNTGHTYAPLPRHNPACERVFAEKGPQILSPTKDMTYLIFSDLQKITLLASSGLDVKEHNWYVDNKFIGRKKRDEKIFLAMNNGHHKIMCVDEKGRSSAVTITVKHL